MQVPTPAYPYKHKLPIQVRFNDFDAMGHINNTIFMQYMDLGKQDFILLALGDNFDVKKDALVVAHIESDFYNIAVFGEPLEVLTAVEKVTEHTIVLDQRVVNSDTGEVKCTCRSVMVGYDAVACTKMVIPDTWKRLIANFES